MKNDNQMIILKEMVLKESFDCNFSLEKNELKNINHSIYDITFMKLMAIINILGIRSHFNLFKSFFMRLLSI
jgi:hypothetical protein